MPDASFEGWVVVELLGHRILSGYARSVPLLGTEALRLDVALPEGNDPHTEFFFAHSIYGIVLSSQEAAQARAYPNLHTMREAGLRPWARWDGPAPAHGLWIWETVDAASLRPQQCNESSITDMTLDNI